MSISEDLHDRATRAANNQTLLRALNQPVNEPNRRMGFVDPVTKLICECANDTCVEPIEMSANEYEAIRQGEACFFVAPSDEHFWPAIERVIEHHDRYWVVEKIAHAAASAKPPLRLRT